MNMLQNRNNRRFLQVIVLFLTLFVLSGVSLADHEHVRFGVTPTFLHDQHQLLAKWQLYLTKRLGRKVEFIQRDSYQETMDLMRLNQLDFAWVSDYPYLHLRDLVRLVVVPLYHGKPAYRSYLIVSSKDKTTRGYEDLRGKIFAFADPYSNTGYLSPRFEIKKMGEDPESYFLKTFFTWSHRKVIEAVASGLAHAGSVESYVWDTLVKVEPQISNNTRIVWQSPEYGFPPLVAHRLNVQESDFLEMQKLLMEMKNDPQGREILADLDLDGFSIQKPDLYQGVVEMMREFGEYSAP